MENIQSIRYWPFIKFIQPDVDTTDPDIDPLFYVRVVPDGREGSVVYLRVLNENETDTGQVVEYKQDEEVLGCRSGAASFTLNSIDAAVATLDEDGYAPITNSLLLYLLTVGLTMGTNMQEDAQRFVLAAGRRLDASHLLLQAVRSKLRERENSTDPVIQRTLITEIVQIIEPAIISLHRALYMISKLQDKFDEVSMNLPDLIANKLPTIKKIRDAYEHIDERAFSQVFTRVKPEALSIFDYRKLFENHSITYEDSNLDIDDEVISILLEARKYLKTAAADIFTV